MEPKFVWEKKSVQRVRKNLKNVMFKSSRIIGTLGEMMDYAPRVEAGTRELAPGSMAHMGPAFMEWMTFVKTHISQKVSKELGKVKDASKMTKSIDLFLFKVVVGAMFEFERLRVKKLREVIYTVLRWAANPKSRYKLTQNLMNNRRIEVEADHGVAKERWTKTKLPSIDTRI